MVWNYRESYGRITSSRMPGPFFPVGSKDNVWVSSLGISPDFLSWSL